MEHTHGINRRHFCILCAAQAIIGFAHSSTHAGEAAGALGIRLPDSPAAREALQLATQQMPPSLLNHCIRTFVWASWAADRAGWSYDAEVAFVAAVLHDIGLLQPYEVAGHSFEAAGGDFARGWALARPALAARAGDIGQAIALHTTPGTALNPIREIAMVQVGAGVDLFGYKPYDELTPAQIEAVLTERPRLGFNTGFRSLAAGHVTRHGEPAGENNWLVGFLDGSSDDGPIGPWPE
ncbi:MULTISPECIES: HD domain-containing protein [unclassified Devosia]|uniref:HD domain-containing protein n=1 Tax=unclassified Devosia TaxID=196773 RepID=UPI00086F5FCE|nr:MULTISPECIES: HD domain-containing protein [unclassified Devosia]MBN9364902.1 hypothetical protein [Devosia sp.]ODS90238.1 MAG: hypothetical protein ABS47_08710 [Devosia sp. SCN 66-27]OJX25742.1 MAG: hypothetical protein BGO83_13090 [Devosia sp. 66-14]